MESGLRKLTKQFGKIKVEDKDGKTITWAWDYNKDEPYIKTKK